MIRLLILILSIFCVLVALRFTFDEGTFGPHVLKIPEGFPHPEIPEKNQLSAKRIELGRRLFYDPILSSDSSISCATCHQQENAFASNLPVTPGVNNVLGTRNAPTLTNVAYNPTFLFDGFLKTLEMQILVPIEEHAEMNFNIVLIAERLRRSPTYVKMSYEAYNQRPNHFVITRSIASFERTLISGNSKFDWYYFQGKDPLTKSEKRGMRLFFDELKCDRCHGGFNFTSFLPKNNGLYEAYADSGRFRVSKKEEDLALFKVPTLRNIELTSPYMHDGSLKSLEEVLDHYASGGKPHPNKDPQLKPFTISKRAKNDLINFLKTLTDYDFVENPAFSNPFKK